MRRLRTNSAMSSYVTFLAAKAGDHAVHIAVAFGHESRGQRSRRTQTSSPGRSPRLLFPSGSSFGKGRNQRRRIEPALIPSFLRISIATSASFPSVPIAMRITSASSQRYSSTGPYFPAEPLCKVRLGCLRSPFSESRIERSMSHLNRKCWSGPVRPPYPVGLFTSIACGRWIGGMKSPGSTGIERLHDMREDKAVEVYHHRQEHSRCALQSGMP